MPYVRRNRKTKKRPAKKRRNYRRKNRVGRTLVNTKGSPLPPSFQTKLRYGYYNVNNVSVADYNQIRLNSLYDPDYNFTGHQPYGFDTLTTMYARYIVYSCTVDMVFTNTSTTSPALVTIVAVNYANDIAPGSSMAPIELPFAKTFVVTNDKPYRHRATYYPNRITGVTRSKYDAEEGYSGTSSANPFEVINLHTIISTVAGAARASADVSVNAVITYKAKFFDANTLGQS